MLQRVTPQLVLMISLALSSCSKNKNEPGVLAPQKDANETAKGPTQVAASSQEKEAESAKAQPTIAQMVAAVTWKPQLSRGEVYKHFTGFDGVHDFAFEIKVKAADSLPAAITGTLSEEQRRAYWASAEYAKAGDEQYQNLELIVDPAFLSLEVYEENPILRTKTYMAKTLKAGATSFKVKMGSKELSVAVEIASYTPAQVLAGQLRYTTAVAGANPSPACVSCHDGSASSQSHAPQWLSGYSDAGILATIKTGVNTDGNYKTKITHKMTFSAAADEEGIVPYLRSIDPRTYY